jgi:hypothetical protein
MTKILSRISTAVFAGVMISACGQGQIPSQIADAQTQEMTGQQLFSDVTDQEAQSVDSAQAMDPSEVALKKRYVKVNLDMIKRAAAQVAVGSTQKVFVKMPINLFKDESVTVLLDEAQKISNDNVVFTGKIAGDMDSAVSMSLNKDVLIANIRKSTETSAYEVRYAGNGMHTVTLKQDEDEGDCMAEDGQHDGGDQTATAMDMEDGALPSGDTAQATNYISMLIAYTPGARASAGGTSAMVAAIQTAVADTNRAMQDSGVNIRVTLAGTLELSRNESGNYSRDLNYARTKGDGRWDELHSKRAAVKADQVTVIANMTGVTGAAGLGYVNANYANAFTLVKRTVLGQYTVSHELGHNIGLNHSDGYVSSAGRFRTIIAYGSYPRIRRYSNPNIPYNGYKTGDSYHNEAKILLARGYILAGFY